MMKTMDIKELLLSGSTPEALTALFQEELDKTLKEIEAEKEKKAKEEEAKNIIVQSRNTLVEAILDYYIKLKWIKDTEEEREYFRKILKKSLLENEEFHRVFRINKKYNFDELLNKLYK